MLNSVYEFVVFVIPLNYVQPGSFGGSACFVFTLLPTITKFGWKKRYTERFIQTRDFQIAVGGGNVWPGIMTFSFR